MPSRLNRRRFLQQSAGVGTALAVGSFAAPAFAQARGRNDKLRIAVIGIGGRGGDNLRGVEGEEIVALCDVDDNRLNQVAQRFPAAATYNDFRKLYEEMEDKFDAVVVSTADHTHAVASIGAMRLGKHCYCEKPLARTVYEIRRMTEVAEEKGVATQMGTQIHAEANYRRVVELVQAGAIGPIDEVHVWCGKGWGGGDVPAEEQPIPPHFHWDLWLGPAPYRPYHSIYAPANWRKFWAFGSGTLGDMGCHYMDLVFWALGLKYPLTAVAEGPEVHPETAPLSLEATWEFPARGEQPPVTVTWYDGEKRPPILAEHGLGNWGGAGVLFLGEHGTLVADYGRHQLLPQEKFVDYQRPAQSIPASIGHHAEWIHACKTGAPTTCNFGYSGPLAETVQLGTVAYRVGKKLEWDAENLKAVNCPEADAFLRPTFREGWEIG